MKALIARIEMYLKVAVLCSGIVSGFWFSLVKPALARIIHDEVFLVHMLAMKDLTDEQYDNVLKEYRALKGKP